MASKKKTSDKTKGTTGAKKANTKNETVAENPILSKNPVRTLMFKDLMLQEIVEGLKAEQVDKEEMEEALFLTTANAVLEMVGANLPEELLFMFQDNLDDYITITMINREHSVDLLARFRDGFLEVHGDDFDDERALMEALTAYEEEWWGSPKDFLGDRSPNDLMAEAKRKMVNILYEGEEDRDEEMACDEEEYWASRAFVIRDLWFSSMEESMTNESMPTPQRRERLFMAATNALLDMVVNVMPDFMSEGLFDGLDRNLELSLVNKEAKIDLLKDFELALTDFEREWWNTGVQQLGGKSPNEAMQAMGRKYGL
ncbi:MAG: hypothetical protein JXA45_02025 [Methanomassiliicoccales archaeon]|nr:hypothetical protein [Methanomassiliicoccales archaeon]